MTIYTIEVENNKDETLIKELLSRLGIKFEKVQKGKKTKEMDETDYLFSTETNKKRLLNSIENADKGENLTEVNLDSLKEQLGFH